jgi:hypothetical protein
MTWSIAHELTFGPSASNAPADQHTGGPWEYHFETFLPAHGWTVSAEGESGGLTKDSATDRWYGCEKTNTYADGRTSEVKFIAELEYQGNSDVHYYSWDGTPGSGASGSQMAAYAYMLAWPSVYTRTYKWFVSDEHTDAWMLLVDINESGYETGLTAFSLPTNGYVVDPKSIHAWVPLHDFGKAANFEVQPYLGNFSQFQSVVRFFNPNWTIGTSNGVNNYGFNQLTDVMLKVDASQTAYTRIEAQGPSSLLIGSDYWIDLNPTSDQSICIKTGATDFGLL